MQDYDLIAELEKNFENNDPLITLADALQSHLLLLDINERIVFANMAMLSWWNTSRDAVTGKHMKEIIGEDAYRVLHGYSLDVISGQKVEYVAPFTKDGQISYFKNTYTPFKDQNGNIKGFIATGTDITEQVNLEIKVKELTELLSKYED